MAVEIAIHNIADGFSDRQRAAALVDEFDGLEAAQPDAAFFSEAYALRDPQFMPRVVNRFERMNFDVRYEPYGDQDGRNDTHGWLAVARKGLLTQAGISVVTLGGRTAARMEFPDRYSYQGYMGFTGSHLNDRDPASQLRAVDEYAEMVDLTSAEVWGGDHNAMHNNDRVAKVLQWLEPWAQRLPYRNPGEPVPQDESTLASHLKRVGSLTRRFAAMASSETVARMEDIGLRDLDYHRRPTMTVVAGPMVLRVAQLDRFMRSIDVTGYVTDISMPRDDRGKPLSDHCRVTATVRAMEPDA